MKLSALLATLLAMLFAIVQPIEMVEAKDMGKMSIGDGSFKDPVTGMEFVPVPAGCFRMGDTFGDGAANEQPVHEVCLEGFSMGKYEVTQGEWKKVMWNNPSSFSGCGDNCPVENVSWKDAQEFIRRLNQQSGRSYRLPTEAEWEYAARSGGRREKYSGGDNIDVVAWYSGNAAGTTHTVGRKQPNGLGIFDMSGNVLEWVGDSYDEEYYCISPRSNPQGPLSGLVPILRGGSWYDGQRGIRASDRGNYAPAGLRGGYVGLRLASSPVKLSRSEP